MTEESQPAVRQWLDEQRRFTKSQIAARAVLELLPELRNQSKKRQGRRDLENSDRDNRANHLAAKAAGLGTSIISDASIIHRESPELFQRVLNGELTVNMAWNQLKHVAAPKSPRKPAQRQIDYATRNMIGILSQIRGLCRTLSMMDISMILAGLSPEDRKIWIGITTEVSTQLRTFKRRLQPDESSQT